MKSVQRTRFEDLELVRFVTMDGSESSGPLIMFPKEWFQDKSVPAKLRASLAECSDGNWTITIAPSEEASN